ncbi:hypothetical protein GCM10011490_01660 [Pseudoclavibacter endophyticus]|uniref:MerR family transcriptional regulator n=1 Tax=Pseudoclavibacter endophyticus TaxID=1778590 RepID=A0A6H9WN28_9MICO|nr:MerR family transcriptional regulator [Pseudoclavibacter endophyticus]KAB1650286.1 MerR family transcriptional regulator [Pseudoclavibacter endophyticus]GGA55456.1 hypothetical protein GCM10011490_01660 [Pseudoclavibacter endophyticus]
MKLRQLAERTGASTATIKYWIREGIVPPGTLRNQTTAEYGTPHVERVELVRTLRGHFDLSIAEVRRLTSMIDDERAPVLGIMEACQLIATGLRRPEAPVEARHADLVGEVVRGADWPDVASVARDALAEALHVAEAAGFAIPAERLAQYAASLAEIAERDIEVVRRFTAEPSRAVAGGRPARQGGATSEQDTWKPSRDVVATRMLRGAHVQVQLLLAMNQLAHTSAAIRAHRDDAGGDVPPPAP